MSTYRDPTQVFFRRLVEGTDAYVWGALILLGFVIAIANYLVLQGRTGATVGKFATGIRTVDKNHRRVADLIGGTLVVHKAYLAQRAAQPMPPQS